MSGPPRVAEPAVMRMRPRHAESINGIRRPGVTTVVRVSLHALSSSQAPRLTRCQCEVAAGANWSLHDLRHRAAYRMARDRGMPLTDVQWVLGHAGVGDH